jgi:hypothetical protein
MGVYTGWGKFQSQIQKKNKKNHKTFDSINRLKYNMGYYVGSS